MVFIKILHAYMNHEEVLELPIKASEHGLCIVKHPKLKWAPYKIFHIRSALGMPGSYDKFSNAKTAMSTLAEVIDWENFGSKQDLGLGKEKLKYLADRVSEINKCTAGWHI